MPTTVFEKSLNVCLFNDIWAVGSVGWPVDFDKSVLVVTGVQSSEVESSRVGLEQDKVLLVELAAVEALGDEVPLSCHWLRVAC